jgi:hypothetical protein
MAIRIRSPFGVGPGDEMKAGSLFRVQIPLRLDKRDRQTEDISLAHFSSPMRALLAGLGGSIVVKRYEEGLHNKHGLLCDFQYNMNIDFQWFGVLGPCMLWRERRVRD